MYEIEGIISTRDSCMHFLKKWIPFFPEIEVLLKPKEQRAIKIEAPFMDEISGLVNIRLLNHKTGYTNTIKVKYVRNTGFLDVTNN